MRDERKYVERNLRKIRTKLWDTMYSDRQYIEEEEYRLLDEACVLLTEAISFINHSKGEEK